MHNSIRLSSVYLLFSLLILSCAVQSPPTGGTKDTTYPKVEKIIPQNKTTNFDKKEIRFYFDEFILLQHPEEQIVISPPLEENPEFTVSGRLLKVSLRSRLKKNTTYTINFGNAIIDNHEGNILENLLYVFTTGNYLDSNKISGLILNSFTTKPEKSIVVGLYGAENFYDSLIFKSKPEYFSRTKTDGTFSIENIPAKKFVLVGFNDENKNLKYNKNEALVFAEKELDATDTLLTKTKYRLFNPDVYPINRILDTFSREKGKFSFLVYKPTNIHIKPIKKATFFNRISRVKNEIDTLFVYSNELRNDSVVSFYVEQPDTLFRVSILAHKKIKTPPLTINLSPYLELNDSMFIFCSNPYKSIDTTHIILKEDTFRIKPFFITDSQSEKITLVYNWKEKNKYSILIKDSAIIDIFGQYNKKFIIETSTRGTKDYSSLKLKIELTKSVDLYIIQLISDDENFVFKEFMITQGEERLFEYLLPGNYKIKIIRDANKNGKWDNGDYFLKRPPEDVYYHPETITLKAYWDLEQTINLNSIIDR